MSFLDSVPTHLRQKIEGQVDLVPGIYSHVDFSIAPERFAEEPAADTAMRRAFKGRRAELLRNRERVELIKAYTMIGDAVADAYAALMPKYGFKGLVGMLDKACEGGIGAVADAPQELKAFIRDMERVPDWLNMKLVREGARYERNSYAHLAPLVIRGGLLATFMNKYSALPMALTGTFSNSTAAKRVLETATFFTTTVQPGALERNGEGFKAAAKVRLMHSMVRFNIMRHGTHWDAKVFGVPIPQVDQMPAGLVSCFLMSIQVLKKGRTSFNEAERARVELARYRCFLLGLPEELLANNPRDIIDLMLTRHATLRKGFDDATCGALIRATLDAKLSSDDGVWGRIRQRMEQGFSKLFFVRNFADSDFELAARLGIKISVSDRLWGATAALLAFVQMTAYAVAAKLPGLRQAVDAALVRKVARLLRSYGEAEFTTDAAAYRPAHTI